MTRTSIFISAALTVCVSLAAAQSLPAGHPTLEQMQAAAATQASQPAPVMDALATAGSLTITFIPGTAGSTVKEGQDVTVELYHRATAVKKYQAKTDAQGKVILTGLPIMPPVQGLVTVQHGGLMQEAVTPELSPTNPSQTLQLKVFDATETRPAWNIAMEHMILEWHTEGQPAVHVTQMISAFTPGDRAWTGEKIGERRESIRITLPAGAQDIKLAADLELIDGRYAVASTLFPGRSEFRLSYVLPTEKGIAQLPIVSPASVDNLIVFAPADGAQITVDGIAGGDVVDAGQGKMRMYRAQNLPAGSTPTLTISNIAGIPRTVTPVAATGSSDGAFSPRNLAVAGAFVLVLIGAGMVLMKKPETRKA